MRSRALRCQRDRRLERSEERRVGKECRSRCDWSSDVSSPDLYAGALPASRRIGDLPEARALLAKAEKTNKHVTAYLCGDEPLPREQPKHYSPGDECEAVLYAASAIGAWKDRKSVV